MVGRILNWAPMTLALCNSLFLWVWVALWIWYHSCNYVMLYGKRADTLGGPNLTTWAFLQVRVFLWLVKEKVRGVLELTCKKANIHVRNCPLGPQSKELRVASRSESGPQPTARRITTTSVQGRVLPITSHLKRGLQSPNENCSLGQQFGFSPVRNQPPVQP